MRRRHSSNKKSLSKDVSKKNSTNNNEYLRISKTTKSISSTVSYYEYIRWVLASNISTSNNTSKTKNQRTIQIIHLSQDDITTESLKQQQQQQLNQQHVQMIYNSIIKQQRLVSIDSCNNNAKNNVTFIYARKKSISYTSYQLLDQSDCIIMFLDTTTSTSATTSTTNGTGTSTNDDNNSRTSTTTSSIGRKNNNSKNIHSIHSKNSNRNNNHNSAVVAYTNKHLNMICKLLTYCFRNNRSNINKSMTTSSSIPVSLTVNSSNSINKNTQNHCTGYKCFCKKILLLPTTVMEQFKEIEKICNNHSNHSDNSSKTMINNDLQLLAIAINTVTPNSDGNNHDDDLSKFLHSYCQQQQQEEKEEQQQQQQQQKHSSSSMCNIIYGPQYTADTETIRNTTCATNSNNNNSIRSNDKHCASTTNDDEEIEIFYDALEENDNDLDIALDQIRHVNGDQNTCTGHNIGGPCEISDTIMQERLNSNNNDDGRDIVDNDDIVDINIQTQQDNAVSLMSSTPKQVPNPASATTRIPHIDSTIYNLCRKYSVGSYNININTNTQQQQMSDTRNSTDGSSNVMHIPNTTKYSVVTKMINNCATSTNTRPLLVVIFEDDTTIGGSTGREVKRYNSSNDSNDEACTVTTFLRLCIDYDVSFWFVHKSSQAWKNILQLYKNNNGNNNNNEDDEDDDITNTTCDDNNSNNRRKTAEEFYNKSKKRVSCSSINTKQLQPKLDETILAIAFLTVDDIDKATIKTIQQLVSTNNPIYATSLVSSTIKDNILTQYETSLYQLFERNRHSKGFWYITSDDAVTTTSTSMTTSDNTSINDDNIVEAKWKALFDDNGSMLTVIVGTYDCENVNTLIDEIIVSCQNDKRDYFVVYPTRFWIQSLQLLCRHVTIKQCKRIVAVCLSRISYNDGDLMKQLRSQARRLLLNQSGAGCKAEIRTMISKVFTNYQGNQMKRKVVHGSSLHPKESISFNNGGQVIDDDIFMIRYEINPNEILDTINDQCAWIVLIEQSRVDKESDLLYKIVNACNKYDVPFMWIPNGWKALNIFFENSSTGNHRELSSIKNVNGTCSRCFCILKPASGQKNNDSTNTLNEIQHIIKCVLKKKSFISRRRIGRGQMWPILTKTRSMPLHPATDTTNVNMPDESNANMQFTEHHLHNPTEVQTVLEDNEGINVSYDVNDDNENKEARQSKRRRIDNDNAIDVSIEFNNADIIPKASLLSKQTKNNLENNKVSTHPDLFNSLVDQDENIIKLNTNHINDIDNDSDDVHETSKQEVDLTTVAGTKSSVPHSVSNNTDNVQTSENIITDTDDTNAQICMQSDSNHIDDVEIQTQRFGCTNVLDIDVSAVDEFSIRLEAEIALLEMEIKTIKSRNDAVSQQLTSKRMRSTEIEASIQTQEIHSSNLKQELDRHEPILHRFSESIRNSKQSLRRLKEVDVTFDEIAKLQAIQLDNDDKENLSIESTASIPAFDSCQIIDNVNSPEDSTVAVVNQFSAFLRWTDFYPGHSHRDSKDVFRYTGLSQGSLLGSIQSEQELLMIIQLSTREIIALDGKEMTGRHRREFMWGTSIDVRNMRSIEFSNCNLVEEAGTIVETKETTDNSRIDPDVAICPHELMGACSDPNCTYQHFLDRKFGSVLPKELLPLPDLLTLGSERIADRVSYKYQIDNTSTISTESEHLVEDTDDFVLLPRAQESEVIPKRDEVIRLWISRSSSLNKFWWMTDKQLETLSANQNTASFIEIMSSIFLNVDILGGKLHLSDNDIPINNAGVCRFLGMIIDTFRLSIHCGRFEFSNAILVIFVQVKESYRYQQEDTSACNINESMTAIHGLLTETNNTVRYNDSTVQRNTIESLFVAQVLTCLSSHFFEQLYQHCLNEPDACFPDCSDVFDTFKYMSVDSAISDEVPINEFVSSLRDELYVKRVDDINGGVATIINAALELLKKLQACYRLAKRCSYISIDSAINEILIPTLHGTNRMVRDSAEADEEVMPNIMTCSAWVAFAVIGCLEKMANTFQTDKEFQSNKTQLYELFTTINNLLKVYLTYGRRIPSIELMMTPIVAANLSLGCTIGAYSYVNEYLTDILQVDAMNNSQNIYDLDVASLSEYFWSQFIQLRMSLPTIQRDSVSNYDRHSTWKIPDSVNRQHDILSKLVFKKGVFPNHVALINDWNLSKALHEERITGDSDEFSEQESLCKFCANIRQTLSNSKGQKYTSFTLRDHALYFLPTNGKSSVYQHPIPYSLLLAAPNLTKLTLSGCSIAKLALQFGYYFSNLKYIDISKNNIEELPISVSEMTQLEFVNVSCNRLGVLPVDFGPRNLKHMNASNNRLHNLPDKFLVCQDLEVLNIDGNVLDSSFWSMAGMFVNLRELHPNRQT